MRCVPIVLVIAILVAGCGPTVRQQRDARLEAFRLELDSTLERWKSDVSLRRFGTSADAARALATRYDMVYERWGLRADPLAQAAMAYALALATRVDRKDLSADEANALLARMDVDMKKARSTLAARHSDSPTDRDAAMLSWWKDYWAANQQAYRIAPGNPVRCESPQAGTHGNPVKCF
jgi:uncharacterized membrane-anchored protein YhcB (DUF1043 family)